MEDREKIIQGLEKTYIKLIEFKKCKNSPLVVAKDDQIIEIDPITIDIHDCCLN